MKKSIVLFLLIFSVVTIGCNGAFHSSIEGSGDEISKSFNVSEFSQIDASHAFEIQVVVGEQQSVKIKTDDNLMKYIEVSVKGNTLYLDVENNINLDGDVKAIISVRNLNALNLSGACKIDIENIDSENFNIDVSGACKGTFSGKVENLTLDLSGATKLNTVDLKAKNLNIDMSGASKLEVYCDNNFVVDASGASKITVYGDPKTTKTDFSGASSVKFKWFYYSLKLLQFNLLSLVLIV